MHTRVIPYYRRSAINTPVPNEQCKWPKVIFLCNKTIGDNEYRMAMKWQSLHPDYEIHLYDDSMIKNFLLNEYGELYVNIFDYLNSGPIKADFWRLCILYKYGGVYSDIDNDPLVKLEDFIEKDVDFVTCSSYIHYNYNPNFIVSNKGNSILKNCIDWYIHKYNKREPFDYWEWSIMNAFTQVLQLDNYNKESGIYRTNGINVQIIKECPGTNHYDAHNMYKNTRVFNNRCPDWDAGTHSFR
jgi:hypothetical protein